VLPTFPITITGQQQVGWKRDIQASTSKLGPKPGSDGRSRTISGGPVIWNVNVGDAEIGIYGGHVTSIENAGFCPSPSHVTSSGPSDDRATSNVTWPFADRGHVTSSVPLPTADHVTSICSSSANVTCRPDDSHW